MKVGTAITAEKAQVTPPVRKAKGDIPATFIYFNGNRDKGKWGEQSA